MAWPAAYLCKSVLVLLQIDKVKRKKTGSNRMRSMSCTAIHIYVYVIAWHDTLTHDTENDNQEDVGHKLIKIIYFPAATYQLESLLIIVSKWAVDSNNFSARAMSCSHDTSLHAMSFSTQTRSSQSLSIVCTSQRQSSKDSKSPCHVLLQNRNTL